MSTADAGSDVANIFLDQFDASEFSVSLSGSRFETHSAAYLLGCYELEIAAKFLVKLLICTIFAKNVSKEGV